MSIEKEQTRYWHYIAGILPALTYEEVFYCTFLNCEREKLILLRAVVQPGLEADSLEFQNQTSVQL